MSLAWNGLQYLKKPLKIVLCKFDHNSCFFRSSHQRSCIKNVFLKIVQNSQKNTRASFLISLIISLIYFLIFFFFAGLSPVTILKKRLWHRCFPVNIAKFLRTPFLQKISGRLLLFFVNNRTLSNIYDAAIMHLLCENKYNGYCRSSFLNVTLMLRNIWDKVFKRGLSKFCGRQP